MPGTHRSFLLLLSLLVSMAAVGQITNTIYVPAMGEMAALFVVLPTHIQTVMAVYLITYGLSQFIYGPLSDVIGRRPVVLLGLTIFVLGSLIAACATVFDVLLLGSVIQGAGVGVAGVMSRTVMRDVYAGKLLHKASSYVSMALIFAPLAAPLLGGMLTHSFGWRGNFIFLLIFGLLVLIYQFTFFKETNAHVGQLRTSFKTLCKDHQEILTHRVFMGYLLCLLVTFAGVSVFEASAGVIFSQLMHYTPRMISVLFVIPVPFYLLGAYVSGRLGHRFPLGLVIKVGALSLLLSSCVMFVIAAFGVISALLVLLPVSVYLFGGGILFPAATAGALEPFPRRAGTAGAILGGMQNLGAGLVTAISATIPQRSILPLASFLFVLSLVAMLAYFFLIRQRDGYTAVV